MSQNEKFSQIYFCKPLKEIGWELPKGSLILMTLKEFNTSQETDITSKTESNNRLE